MSSSGYACDRFFIAFLLIGPVVSFPWGFSQLRACGDCVLVAIGGGRFQAALANR